ncbi:hypothetical protein MXMO3_03602 (plasmid) [Maritalea myrionectae]|uniref:HTH luxR-type domain-containing protein n=1 Tax=Maritalea myrionectae TaxID=454601 RepID=A0A2R4MJF3_9HYPH|nr:helix-turn-helix transcriptional regulator [Maritalea myrionectae]AVX06105.1 hypothetical protein MXMO3_03602 [Maritalea myrionectae]
MNNPTALNDFLLDLYNNASVCKPDQLRLRVLESLQQFIGFDFAVWGGGWADGRQVTDLTVLNQSQALLGEWERVAEQDAFCDLTLKRLGVTARFDDVPRYREGMAFNEHWRQFDAAHMMATIVGEKTDGYVSFVGLCAEKRSVAFSDAERNFKQMLMPHLSQALRMNRDLWVGRAALEREAVALVDEAGWVLTAHGQFFDFARNEWRAPVRRLPDQVMRILRHSGHWRGKTLNLHLSPFGNTFFVHLSVQPTLVTLSPREREVAEHFAAGLTNKQVAHLLGTAPATVRNQINRIYEKLGISNKAQLAALISKR